MLYRLIQCKLKYKVSQWWTPFSYFSKSLKQGISFYFIIGIFILLEVFLLFVRTCHLLSQMRMWEGLWGGDLFNHIIYANPRWMLGLSHFNSLDKRRKAQGRGIYCNSVRKPAHQVNRSLTNWVLAEVNTDTHNVNRTAVCFK